MLPRNPKKWNKFQIILFSQWLASKNHLIFLDKEAICKELDVLPLPYSFFNGKRVSYKKIRWLVLDPNSKQKKAIKLKRHIVKKQHFGLWSHQLTLMVMIYLKFIEMPTMPIDPGGVAVIKFCVDVWKEFLTKKKYYK